MSLKEAQEALVATRQRIFDLIGPRHVTDRLRDALARLEGAAVKVYIEQHKPRPLSEIISEEEREMLVAPTHMAKPAVVTAVHFPFRFWVSKKLLEEFAASEHGSFEDAGGDENKALDQGLGCAHVYRILKRGTRYIEVNDATEARAVYLSVSSGTFQLHHLPTATCIADAFRIFATPEDVKLWPGPSGL